MRSKEKLTKVTLRTISMVVLILLAPAMLTTGAFAQPPSNDDFDNATVISSLPFSDTINNEEATRAADDPSSCFGETRTVWYSFTAGEDVTIQANTFGSEFQTSLSVYTGSRGNLDGIICSTDEITFEATAGETYYFLIGSFEDFLFGEIVFNVDVIDIPDVEVSINPTGRVIPSTGEVTVSGTVTCSDAASVELFGDVQQRAGRLNIQQSFFVSLSCAGGEEPTQWSATFTGENGRFVAGRASVKVDASVCTSTGCIFIPDEEPTTVQLRGSGNSVR